MQEIEGGKNTNLKYSTKWSKIAEADQGVHLSPQQWKVYYEGDGTGQDESTRTITIYLLWINSRIKWGSAVIKTEDKYLWAHIPLWTNSTAAMHSLLYKRELFILWKRSSTFGYYRVSFYHGNDVFIEISAFINQNTSNGYIWKQNLRSLRQELISKREYGFEQQ